MLGWGKTSEGSDIRSKFELRREQVRQRVRGARRAAGAQIHTAGAVTVAGLRAAGGAVLAGARASRQAAASGTRRTLNRAAATATIAGQRVRAATGAVADVLGRPGTVAAAGAMMLGAGIGRYRAAGFDGEVMAMLAVGGALLVLPVALPVLAGLSPLVGTAAVAIAVFAAAAFWAAYRNTPGLAGLGESK